jgi:DNA-binding transcriptional ArsR family regulator
MSSIASLAEIGTLVGEPTRTAMLVALMEGRALTAGELARVSGVTPPTASGHLSRLVERGLLALTVQGRRRYFRLASPATAQMIEHMMGVAGIAEAARRSRPVVSGPSDKALRRARRCYDHLAGTVAVELAAFLARSGYLDLAADMAIMTEEGIAFLEQLGVDVSGCSSKGHQRAFCRPCMDWSERRPHLAGAIGRSLLQFFIDRHWMRRSLDSRAVSITPIGIIALERHFAIGSAEGP